MEKDSSHFCYDTYPTVSKSASGNVNSLKRDTSKNKTQETSSCSCLGKKTKSRGKAFLAGLATNLGICVLLFGYTLIGSVIFLAIEGGSAFQHQILATTSLATTNTNKKYFNHSAELKLKNDEARARTVENIWEITVSLNILYRDNWTRLAAQEITRFQDELVKYMTEEMANQQPMQEANISGKHIHEPYEWTFAKAFLYSLTVLTTIGKFPFFFIFVYLIFSTLCTSHVVISQNILQTHKFCHHFKL